MKVIGFTGNYGCQETDQASYLMADSSILYTGRPFFVPDYARQFMAAPSIVVRMGRLGKCVAPKFAHRYWDALAPGFNVVAIDGDDRRLAALGRAFDGAAIVGDWMQVDEVEDPLQAVVEFKVDGSLIASRCLADMTWPLHDMVAAVSTRCSIKMGDILFTGDAAPALQLVSGMHLTACIGNRQLLDVKVRL